MVVKNEDLQEHTKRLRFKPLANIQHSSGDIVDSKCSKDLKTKGVYRICNLSNDNIIPIGLQCAMLVNLQMGINRHLCLHFSTLN